MKAKYSCLQFHLWDLDGLLQTLGASAVANSGNCAIFVTFNGKIMLNKYVVTLMKLWNATLLQFISVCACYIYGEGRVWVIRNLRVDERYAS